MIHSHARIALRAARRVARRPMLALVCVLAAFTATGAAQAANSASHLRIGHNEIGRTQHIEVGVNKSVLVDLPVGAGEVIVSQPDVANAIMRTQTRAVVQGMDVGETNMFFLDPNGNSIAVLEISVAQDAGGLTATLNRLIPGGRIDVQSFSDRVVLSGRAQSADDVQKAIDIAAQFAGSPDNVASVIEVDGGQQVALQVVVAEASREAIRQFGINLSGSINGNLQTALVSSNPLGGASGVSGNSAIQAGFSAGNVSLQASLRALERNGALRTLASPTLTALSGQPAEFLAGGEFPVPTEIDDDGRISYTFKEFGVELNFTPTVRSNGIIGLNVDTSVSELTTEGGINTGAFTIPATRERSASTSVELQSGSTLAIAGLIEDEVRQQVNQLPGLGNIPILGALFRSRDYIHSQTELVILVTPRIAQATHGKPEIPTDGRAIASDAEAIFLGRMEDLYGVGARKELSTGIRGSVGFVLD